MNVNRMYSMQKDIMYLQSRRKVTQYYVLSLLSDFMKTVLLLFDTLIFCFTISTALLMMLFGYVGVISEKPIPLHGKLYIGIVYFDILLNFLIALVCIYNIFRMSTWNLSYMAKFIVNRNFFYSIMTMIIGLCLLSIVFNIYVLYYRRRFKTLVRAIENETKNARANARLYLRSNLRSSTKGSKSARGNANMRTDVQRNTGITERANTRGNVYIHGNVFHPESVPTPGKGSTAGILPAEGNALEPKNAQSNRNGNKSRKAQGHTSTPRNGKEERALSGEKISITLDDNTGPDGKPLEDSFTLEKPYFNVAKMVFPLDPDTKINDMVEDNTKAKLNMKKKITLGLDKEQQSIDSRRKKIVHGDIPPMKIEIVKEEVKEELPSMRMEEKELFQVNTSKKEVHQGENAEKELPQMSNVKKNFL
ncbi:hypothetical protein C922_04428 [Plasmodium inui San Antonio 1]|uniref:Uncharacterized protein n=1 Tax=Plasmodium inui San Antonio 1 TaxID=1237626 RepID=W6ZWH8_9APIC|nr:hypothetical protein C922_04428 [Plasmodium inui San Antonio 1]EUD65142.1 hypothetical protein C922_04428 [Plasmodium inui San Antonio 1]